MRVVEPGSRGELTHRVREEDTAERWANDVPVLATPVLLWLGEVACMRAVEHALEEGEMTVGAAYDCQHLAPTPAGFEVRVTATVVESDGRRLVFDVEAGDGADLVFRGTHSRRVVDRARFLARVAAKRAALEPVDGGRAAR